MFPDSPVRPQWRPSNTHAAAFTHTADAYVCAHICQSVCLNWQIDKVGSDSSPWILPATASSTCKWDHLNDSSFRRFSFATWQSPDVLASRTSAVTQLPSPAPVLSLLIFIVLVCERERKAGLVSVLTFIQCVSGWNGLVGTCHVTASALFYLSL